MASAISISADRKAVITGVRARIAAVFSAEERAMLRDLPTKVAVTR